MALYTEALKALRYAEARVIATVEDLKPAGDDLILIRNFKKAMEEKRKGYLQPFQEHVKEVNEAYKRLMEPIEAADKITGDKILAFNAEQTRIRAEQERINNLRMEAAKAEMRLKGEITESIDLVEVIPEVSKRIVTELGSSITTKVWKFEVTDFSLLPDRFKIENATLIGKVVRAGEREIPGVKIWSEDILRITAR